MDDKKDLYIDNSLIGAYKGNSLFEDIYIEHNSLPEINFNDIDTKVEFMEKNFSFPLIISAMIGGSERSLEINEILFSLAKDLNLPIEVGSQEEYISDAKKSSFFLSYFDDDIKNEAFVISNLSARAEISDIKKAMENISASSFSLYLNSAQEAISYDGDTNFKGTYDNIKKIAEVFDGNFIVKEKTMGMSKSTIKKLVEANVKYIDISGFGGTNFIEMENLRNYRNDFSELYSWGIPTAKSILNAKQISEETKIIASGGIKTGLDIAKALIIGADYVAIAGELLRYILHGGYNQAREYLEDLIYKTKIVMFFLGVKNISELKHIPYKITGKLKEIVDETE